MADTKQLTILKRLTTLIEGITTANGYDYDLAGKVFRGKALFGASEVAPFVSILESLRPDPAPSRAGSEKLIAEVEWELLIQGWVDTDPNNPTDALYGLKGAIEKRLARIIQVDNQGSPLYPSDYRLNRILTSAYIGPGVVRAATPQTGGTEALYLPVVLCYKADVSDPWALG